MTAAFGFYLYDIQVWAFWADDWIAVSGVNRGDSLGPSDDLVLGDTYTLQDTAKARPLNLAFNRLPARRLYPTKRNAAGCVTATYDATVTLMSAEGHVFEGLILIGAGKHAGVKQTYLCPTSRYCANSEYSLINFETEKECVVSAKAASIPVRTITHRSCNSL